MDQNPIVKLDEDNIKLELNVKNPANSNTAGFLKYYYKQNRIYVIFVLILIGLIYAYISISIVTLGITYGYLDMKLEDALRISLVYIPAVFLVIFLIVLLIFMCAFCIISDCKNDYKRYTTKQIQKEMGDDL
jgi:uncharacterized membrane protein